MTYDALQYAGQVAAIAKGRRDKKDYPGHTGWEYLSGFYKEDRILPVITLAVFLGPDRWDGPRFLHEMLSVTDPLLLSLIPDYRIHLIEPASLKPEDLLKFKTSLREVLSFIKYSRDKDRIAKLLAENERFQALDRDAALMIRTCTNIAIEVPKDSEVVNVCKAIDDLMADSRSEGLEEGIQVFILDNLEEKIPKTRILEKLQRRFKLSAEVAKSYFDKYAEKMGSSTQDGYCLPQ